MSRVAFVGLFVGLLLNMQCATSSKATKENAQIYTADFKYEKNQVLILLLDISADHASIRNAKLVLGDFKALKDALTQNESVRVQYLNTEDHVLFEKEFDSPLVQYKEYSDEQGNLQRVRVLEATGSMLLRSRYSTSISSIRIDYGEEKVYRKISQLPLVLVGK